MTDIQGDKPISPQTREIYRQDCERGVNLFQQSLEAYQSSQIDAQKEAYKDVMEKALQVIHETASQFLTQEKQKEELNLEKDYQNYIANPTPENLKTLNQDLQHFKKGI